MVSDSSGGQSVPSPAQIARELDAAHAVHEKLHRMTGTGFRTDADNKDRAICGPLSEKEANRVGKLISVAREAFVPFVRGYEKKKAREEGRAERPTDFYVPIDYEAARALPEKRAGWGFGR